ncbi:hypothetical protein MCOR21_005493 [Pyricularia oryzae]|nr:hypothetical protein MCOR21_005493 [Pyricularia oryzae]
MSSWMNDTSAALPNHNGNGFTHHVTDPSQSSGAMMDPSAYMTNSGQFNPAAAAQFANPQQMLAMQNGNMRNQPGGFPNPVYQTNSVIPSKRPRPREDSLAGSPRPAPGMAPTSRAETPQQNHYANYPPQQQQQQQQPQQQQSQQQASQQQQQPQQQTTSGQPSPYPHLQTNGSANATPSPIMANQMRPGSVPQRVSTASPHPYSPAGQNFGHQASPAPSEQGGTPQPNAYMQQGNYPPAFNQQFAPSPSQARHTQSPMAGQMPGHMGGPMGGQMMPQPMGHLPPQVGQMSPQQMSQMGMMGQMPQQIFPGQMQQMSQMQQMQHLQQLQQMPQAARDQQKLLQQMQMQRQFQQQQQPQQQHQQPPNQHRQPQPQQPPSQQHPQQVAQSPSVQKSPVPPSPQAQPQGVQMSPQMAGQNRNAMARQQIPNGQMPPGAMRPQPGQPMPSQPGMQRGPPGAPEFLEKLSQFMSKQGQPLDPNPIVENRPISLWNLRQAVGKHGGYRNVTQSNLWPNVSNALGMHPMQFQMAPAQLRQIYERNLLRFDDYMAQGRAKQMQQAQQQSQQHPGMPGHAQTPGTPTKPGIPGQMPPGSVMSQQGQPQVPGKQGQLPIMNGFSGTPVQPQPHPAAMQGHARNSLSRSIQGAPTRDDFPGQSPMSAKGVRSSLSGPSPLDPSPKRQPVPAEDPSIYRPIVRQWKENEYAGVYYGESFELVTQRLRELRPDIPPLAALGNIDLHALCRSLQSGIRAEVRMALDTLATFTASDARQFQVDLNQAGELIECLLECAEDQLDVLVDNTVEVSDEILISNYEDVIRACHIENSTMHDEPTPGSEEYELDRAVDRLLCITTIIRNMSFGIVEQDEVRTRSLLAEEEVVKFLCTLIRYLGTRNMLLRTHRNTLDLMKDVVTILSNISTCVEISEREHAYCFLQFALAFAPAPAPNLTADHLHFPPYNPQLHTYLPVAIEAFSKLLVSKEQNRSHFAAILAGDMSQPTPYELLTRCFGLAVSLIPEQSLDVNRAPVPEARKPALMQGLLVAQTILSLAPGHDSEIVRAWLSSGCDFPQKLHRLTWHMCQQFEYIKEKVHQQPRTGRNRGPPQLPQQAYDCLYLAALSSSILRRLAEKARDPADPKGSIPPKVVPSSDLVCELLKLPSEEWTKPDVRVLQQLVAAASLDD